MFAPINLTSSMGSYTYTGAPSPNRPYTPPDSASIPLALTYDLSPAELISEGPSSGQQAASAVASLPLVLSPFLGQLFNLIAAPGASQLTLKHKKRASASKASQQSTAALSDNEDGGEDFRMLAHGADEARRVHPQAAHEV